MTNCVSVGVAQNSPSPLALHYQLGSLIIILTLVFPGRTEGIPKSRKKGCCTTDVLKSMGDACRNTLKPNISMSIIFRRFFLFFYDRCVVFSLPLCSNGSYTQID